MLQSILHLFIGVANIQKNREIFSAYWCNGHNSTNIVVRQTF